MLQSRASHTADKVAYIYAIRNLESVPNIMYVFSKHQELKAYLPGTFAFLLQKLILFSVAILILQTRQTAEPRTNTQKRRIGNRLCVTDPRMCKLG